MSLAKKLTRKISQVDSYMFGPVADFLETEQSEKSDNYSWEAMGYKFYPSAIKSIHMCPKKFVEETVHTAPYFQLSALESMEIGKEYHAAYQNILVRMPGYCQEPDYSYFRSLFGDEEADKLVDKTNRAWPEVSIYDPESGFSMRLDLVPANPLMIVDIKSIGQEDTVKNKKTGEVKYDQWADLKSKMPSGKEEHKLQVSLYCHFANKFKLFPKIIDIGGIAYINTRMPNGDNKYETKFDYTSQMDRMIDALVGSLAKHRNAWIKQLSIPCEYHYCTDHGGQGIPVG